MNSLRHNRGRRVTESGYALLLVMFFLALMVVAMSQAAPTILSSIQRERETEMVWRGKQYVRGVRMYYMKMQHFPTSLDNLTKPQNGIRFMRQAYKDPMNQVDGSWRLIYVGPNGQLIGSYNNQTINVGMATAPGMGAAGATLTNALNSSSSGTFGNTMGNSTFGSSGFGSTQTGATTQTGTAGTTATNATGGSANGASADSGDDTGQPHSIAGPMDASNTIGGNIIGVGSKVDKPSFVIYKKAKNYKKFEFIWDPSADITVGGASMGIGTPIGGTNSNGMSPAGSSPFGSPFSSGVNGTANQGQTPSQNNQNLMGNPANNEPPLQAPPQQ
jgi:hypothetical protein